MCIVRSNYARALGSLCPTLLNADPNEQHQRRERKVGRRRFASRRRRVYIYLLDSGGNGYYILLSRALYLASMSVLSFAAATSLSWGGGRRTRNCGAAAFCCCQLDPLLSLISRWRARYLAHSLLCGGITQICNDIRRIDNKERRGVVDLPAATRTMCVAVQYMVANLQGNQPAW